MLNPNAVAVLSVMAMTGVAQAATPPNFKDGEWDVSYRMEMVGAPFPMPPMSVRKTQCLTSKNYLPDTAQPGQDCKPGDTRVNGNSVTWSMQCRTREGTIEGQGRVTYHGDRYEGSMDAKIVSAGNPGQPIRYKYSMQGRRLGPCKQ
jgi:hypothetical protein